jgi:hypothetical protein
MTRFLWRFIGTLMLDAGAFEDVEADRHSGLQAGATVAITCAAAAFASMSVRAAGAPGFAIGLAYMAGAWTVWAMLISTIGTRLMPEPQTRSNPPELLRTIGFAAAPGVFFVFAAFPIVTASVVVLVSAWMIAAAVIAVRQALDYRSTGRAVAVCLIAWLLSFGLIAAAGLLFVQRVS